MAMLNNQMVNLIDLLVGYTDKTCFFDKTAPG